MGEVLLRGLLLSHSFSTIYNTLPRLLSRKHSSFSLGDRGINTLFYANDIVPISNTKDHLQNTLNACKLRNREYGYVFSPTKCGIATSSDERTPYF